MPKLGESWMPRGVGLSTLGLIFLAPLACAELVIEYAYFWSGVCKAVEQGG